MEEDTELEEGEAKEPCDPDKDFSYLDQKLQLLLGDQQKEFQGCTLSTEKLGSKFGGYGTFLPTQARGPSVLANPLPPPHSVEPMSVLTEGSVESVKHMAGVADKPMHAQSYGEPPTQKVLKKKNGVSNDPIVSKKVMIRFTMGKGGEKETQPKVIQNGLSFDHLSSASLGNDDKHNLSDAEFSPEPSPRSMIKIMTSYHTPRDLLSPLPPSFLESLDRKENVPITLKDNKPAKAPLNTRTPGGRVDPDRGNERKVKADEKEKEKQAAIELRKVSEVVVDGGKRARRDSDVEKKIQNEPVLKGPVKFVRNDVSKGEQQEVSIDKVLEGPSKEDAESGKELMPKSLGGKQTDLKAELAGIASKEKEGSDVKASRKPSAVQDKDSKETTQAKEIIKQQGRKNPEPAKVGTSEKDSGDKIGSLTDGWKQEKDESKEILVFKGNEILKEVKKENRKKDSVSDFIAGDVHKETIKATAKGERTTKNEPINIASQKDVIKDQKRSKTARDTKVGKKERHREQRPVLEAAPKVEYEKVQGRVETAAPAPIVTDPVVMPTQLVLDNWVQCDKCETWRLLLPGIDTPDSSAKWNCKMMVWLPGMNNCKFTEEETTAAVYSYLGLQNPKLVPTTGAHAEMPPLPPVVEPFLKKSAIPADTKRGSRITTDKKRPVGSVPAGGVKTAGSKGADGTENSKSLNDAALDANADEIAYARILADNNKLKEKEKKKCHRTSEGDVTPRKKSVGEEKHIQGSGVKHSGGLNAGMVQGEKDTEQNRVARERDETEAQPLPSIAAKRKKQMEIAAEGNETKSLKKSKGNKVHNNDASLDKEIKVGEHVSSQRGKAVSNVINANDSHHSRQTDIDTHNIASILKDSRSSPEVYKSGESEKGLDQKENGRATNIEKSKLELNKVLDRRKNLKEDEKESEQRAVKRPKQDVHGHPCLESNRHVNRTILASEQEPEILEVTASPAPAAPPKVIGSKNDVFKKESLNYSTLSKVCSSPESSRTGSKAHGSSPIESTVSSSPVRFRKGEREQSRNQRGGPENLSLPNEGVLQQHSWSASPKDGEDASHQFSWDEGEFHHAGAWHGANVSRKHDHSSGAHDEEWNWDEHRGANPGFAYDSHQDRNGQRPDRNWDQDELDGQYERRVNQNSHYDGDRNQGVRDPWPNERPDVQEDPYSREHRTRDDWGRPSSRESRLDKTDGGTWHDEQQLEQGEEVPTKDDTLPATSEHGARDDRFVSKGTSWEGERAAPVSRKENDSATVHSLDIPVPGKRPSATASARVKEDTGKVLKHEGQTSILSKALVNISRDGEGVTGSPVKREQSHVHNPAFSVAKKEARALKHSADHLKNEPGLEVESTNLYLQAALKFLQAAALVENDNTDINRAGETQSMVVYNDTATLCKYCAGQYERRSDMAAAALAYTCAAVALGRRMLCKNVCFARDCNELLTAAQQASAPHVTSNGPLLRPPLPSRSADKPGSSLPMVRDTGIGESPSSSSASDVDNLNNQSLVPSDKGTVTQVGRIGMASPQTMPGAVAPGSHSMVPSHLRSSFMRVLKDASDMSNLLEAWQKAATVTAKAEATCDQKGMLAVKKVGELGGFGDIETVVHLVRVAMDTIGH